MSREPKRRLYFMHPQNTYGTDLERVQLADIRFRLGYDWDIINPNAPTYSTAYHILEESTGDGMPYLTELANSCHGGVFLPFRDGMIPADIAAMVMSFMRRGCPVWEIRHDGRFFRPHTLDEKRVLSAEETFTRIRDAFGCLKQY